jgi:DNA-binding transcriptional LysR family regulator
MGDYRIAYKPAANDLFALLCAFLELQHMRRKIPSTVALTAFESAARHQSFTKAAEELSVTQSAVCRQIATLEALLGVELFRRTKRGVTVTDAGLSYARSVRTRLDEVERDTLELMANGGQGTTLELGVVPTFATNWLLPRLVGFRRSHPHITVNMTTRTRPFLFEDTPLDAAIYAGEASWPGTEGHFLMRENLVAVASPQLIAPRKTLKASDLARLPLLQQTTRPYAWRQWFESQGLRADNDMAGPRLELFSMLAKAAIHGMGVALIPKFLVEDELERGLLLHVVKYAYLSDRSYYLIHPERKANSPALAAFRAWIETEARQYREPMGLG